MQMIKWILWNVEPHWALKSGVSKVNWVISVSSKCIMAIIIGINKWMIVPVITAARSVLEWLLFLTELNSFVCWRKTCTVVRYCWRRYAGSSRLARYRVEGIVYLCLCVHDCVWLCAHVLCVCLCGCVCMSLVVCVCQCGCVCVFNTEWSLSPECESHAMVISHDHEPHYPIWSTEIPASGSWAWCRRSCWRIWWPLCREEKL